MDILNAIKKLRDDLKVWVTNNLNALNSKIDEKTIPIDSELSSTSTNPVQNKAIKKAIDDIPTFSGDYNDLANAPNISEDSSGNMIIVDESGNIIFKADAEGIHTTTVSLNGEAAATERYVDDAITKIPTPDVSGQINAHNTNGESHADIRQAIEDTKEELSESIVAESDEWKVVDEAGNIIFSVDASGAHTTEMTLNGENAATESYVDDAIANIEFPTPDLTDYATKKYVDDAIDGIKIPDVDLTGYAKEIYVDNKIADLVNSAPEALDTLGELATALENHEDAYDALLETVGGKATKQELEAVKKELSESIESESAEWVISDGQGNIIMRVDADGINSTQFNIDDEPVATKIYVDDAIADIDFPLEDGTGKEAVQQIADGVADGIPFNGENPHAQALDGTLAQPQPYGAIGDFSSAFGGKSSAQGKRSHAEGTTTIAKGGYSHVEGNNSVTLGANSHAEGRMTVALGENAHSEGYNTQAQGHHSHAEGVDTIAVGAGAHAEGGTSIANGEYSHAEGETARALSWASHAEGLRTLASNAAAHAEGADTQATAAAAHAEGGGTQAIAQYSHAEGVNTLAQGDESHAEGMGAIAYAPASHAEGNNTRAIADHSHAEGNATEAEGVNSHAEGSQTAARAWASHAEGEATKALGNSSHAEGLKSEARGHCSHAGGENSIAEASHSFASGFNLTTAKTAQAVVGRGNVSDSDAMFVVGAADFDEEQWQMSNYRNAFTTGFDGNESYITVGGVKLTESKLLYLISLDEKIGDIESALDAILKMQEDLMPKHTFIYDTTNKRNGTVLTLTFEPGMTWADWIESDYNTTDIVNYSGSVYCSLHAAFAINSNGTTFTSDTEIVNGETIHPA